MTGVIQIILLVMSITHPSSSNYESVRWTHCRPVKTKSLVLLDGIYMDMYLTREVELPALLDILKLKYQSSKFYF